VTGFFGDSIRFRRNTAKMKKKKRTMNSGHSATACSMEIVAFKKLTILFLILIFSGAVNAQDEEVKKFEIGAQFTLLSRNKPTPLFQSPTIVPDDFEDSIRLGFGGRFTYNLTNNVALEAEGNFFPGNDNFDTDLSVPAGEIFQAQFGVKAGKRFSKFGIFGKARPGFVTFFKASRMTGTTTINFNNQQFTHGLFTTGKETDFSMDVGGVVEFYPSRRIVTRIDFGDTIIRYGEYRRESFVVSVPFLTRPPETKHNFQFSAGVGFRF
jgi:Outer membrane protein beta-barrel domain